MAKTNPLFNMFGRSPIKPIQRHMDKASQAAELLTPFIQAVIKEDWKEAKNVQNQITDFEKQADDLKQDLRLHLPKGLFLPVHRGDLLEIISKQDHIANKAEDIAGLIMGRKMRIPPPIAPEFTKLIGRSIDATHQAKIAINELDELLETGFRGNEVEVVEKMILELNAIEHDTDEIQVNVRKELFNIEDTLSPIDVMFLYMVIEAVGELADNAEIVGGRLQLLLAR